jgi:hypothetical protein
MPHFRDAYEERTVIVCSAESLDAGVCTNSATIFACTCGQLTCMDASMACTRSRALGSSGSGGAFSLTVKGPKRASTSPLPVIYLRRTPQPPEVPVPHASYLYVRISEGSEARQHLALARDVPVPHTANPEIPVSHTRQRNTSRSEGPEGRQHLALARDTPVPHTATTVRYRCLTQDTHTRGSSGLHQAKGIQGKPASKVKGVITHQIS